MRRVACGIRHEPVPLPCSSQLKPARASPRLINTNALHSYHAHLLQSAVVTEAQLLLLYTLQTLKNTEGAAGHASAVARHMDIAHAPPAHVAQINTLREPCTPFGLGALACCGWRRKFTTSSVLPLSCGGPSFKHVFSSTTFRSGRPS